MYSPLDLDDIRLERAEERESFLANKIDKMKVARARSHV